MIAAIKFKNSTEESMRLNRFKLAKYLLREQGEETEEDLAKKLEEPEEPEDDSKSDPEEEQTGDDQASEEDLENQEEELEEVPEEDVETSTYDKIRLKDSLDDELQAVFIDFESDALKSNKINTDITESKRLTLKKVFLLELNEPEAKQAEGKKLSSSEASSKIDVNAFASDVARLIKNYDSLIDMEAVIFNKAKQFILDKYNEATYKEFKNIIVDKHGIDFFEDEQKMENPVAVGAKSSTT